MELEEILPKKVLLSVQKQLFCSDLFDYQSLIIEKESKEYIGCRIQLCEKLIVFRKAKITPTKTGQFVTLYKRNPNKIIAPFDSTDAIDYVVIWVEVENKRGFFIFPKEILFEKKVFSTVNKEGKRAIRVYPSWDITTSKQAITTQKWQLNYFSEF